MGTISKSFSYKEFEVTDVERLKYVNIVHNEEIRDNIKALVLNVLQPLRDAWGKALYINSGYRCEMVNQAVGGQPTSQHLTGSAADVCPFGRNGHGSIETVRQLAMLAEKLELPFDQMILYPSFVHFSYNNNGKQRHMILYSKTYTGKKL